MTGGRKRAVNIGAGALARGLVMPSLLATPRGWEVAFASRLSTSTNRDWLSDMATRAQVLKYILEQELPLVPGMGLAAAAPPVSWSGPLADFHDTSTANGLKSMQRDIADPVTCLVTLNARAGFDELAPEVLASVRKRPAGMPLLIVCCDNTPPPSWSDFRAACDALPNVAAVNSVADRMCVDGASLSLLGPMADKPPQGDVYTERWRRWYIERDGKNIAEQLELDRGDQALGIQLVDDLRPYAIAKLYLMNAVHFGVGALAAAHGEPMLNEFVAAEEAPPTPLLSLARDEVSPRERCQGLVQELRAAVLLRFGQESALDLDDPQGFADEWADRTLHRLQRFSSSSLFPIQALRQTAEFERYVERRLRQPMRLVEGETGREAWYLRDAIRAADALVNAHAWEWL